MSTGRYIWLASLCTMALGALAPGQNPASQYPDTPSPSIGDVARQSRSEHPADAKESRAQGLVDEMQKEQEAEENAPTGFKNYDAGEYKLLVPFPYSLEGRVNGGGAILLGSTLGVTNTEVVAGGPIPTRPNSSNNDLLNWVRAYANQFGQANCYAAPLGQHKGFHCGWSGGPYLMGRQVWGTMKVVVASTSLIPVMCVSPDEMQCVTYANSGYQTCNNRHPSWDEVKRTQAAVATRYRDELTTAQMCEQVIYPSIRLKEDIVVHPASIAEKKVPVAQVNLPPQTPSASTPLGPSLAVLARESRQSPHPKALATLDNAEGSSVPAGFQSFGLQYCLTPQQCSEATVIIPEKAEVVSRTNGQYIFKTFVGGTSMMLYAGPADVSAPYRSLSDRDYIRIRDLANPNGWSSEKPDAISTQDLTIEGKPSLMTRFRYKRDEKTWWIGERLLIGTGSAQFLLGCASPEEHFADAEVLCTTLVNSLRLR